MGGTDGREGTRRYTACLQCTQTCYRTHGMSNFSGSCFFKVMLDDFTKKLKIPPNFVKQIKDRMGPDVILEGPSGQLWPAELCCTGTGMTIEHGWKSFVSDHSIEFGDFLVFKHAGKSHFIIQIFGRSGCEKQSAFTVTSIESLMEEKDKMQNTQSLFFLENNLPTGIKDKTGEDRIDTRNSAMPCITVPDDKMHRSVTRKTKKLTSLSSEEQRIDQIPQAYYPSSSMPVSTANPTECTDMLETGGSIKETDSLKHTLSSYKKEVKLESSETENYDYQMASGRQRNQMALHLKELTDKIRGPYFWVDMKKSHLCPSFRLNVPIDFLRNYLPKSKADITLLGPDKMKWSVTSPGENTTPHSLRGWREFAENYNLKLQDICVFELLNKQNIEVHIQKNIQMSGRRKGSAKRMEYQIPKREDCKFSFQKAQEKIKDERDFSSDQPLISCAPTYQTKKPKQEMCSDKLLKQDCEGQRTILNGERDSVSTDMIDQKPYFLRRDLRRTSIRTDTTACCNNGTPTQNLSFSNVIILE
ncbi:B3 domain-containing protein Os01g0723500 isoform X1 [Cryptomeria japonica]|uniref:B3 domain-containing protein Os01g0723500 isoform X1 n=2 Tax=Cryptomeria japonica TaxID=3369 RepID=UPI0027DA908A|nr:B3 domain-containing protein Os01g0723500 isoform X1 [Cryptomeria japonica]